MACSPDDFNLLSNRGYEYKTCVDACMPEEPRCIPLPYYVQCMVCLACFADFKCTEWYLCFNKLGTSALKVFRVRFDEALWNGVLYPLLSEFADRVETICGRWMVNPRKARGPKSFRPLFDELKFPKNTHRKDLMDILFKSIDKSVTMLT